MGEAKTELNAAADYIERFNPAAALATVRAIRRRMDSAALQPYAAPPLDDTGLVRYLPVPRTRYVLFFEIHESDGRLDVLHVLHERQQRPEKLN